MRPNAGKMLHRRAREFDARVVACEACPRLREWCALTAERKVRRHASEEYWGKPVPSFGPLEARLVIVGLAPGAHGANRTGRMFTGDRSGDWLYRSLHAFGFCSQPHSLSTTDGQQLIDARITAVAHCAPPANRLTRGEIANCGAFLDEELRLLTSARVVLALGRIAFDAVRARFPPRQSAGRPVFSHGGMYRSAAGIIVRASYHPSQQNTFTGRLTRERFDALFKAIREDIDAESYIQRP